MHSNGGRAGKDQVDRMLKDLRIDPVFFKYANSPKNESKPIEITKELQEFLLPTDPDSKVDGGVDQTETKATALYKLYGIKRDHVK